jgi:hypothetical protein
MAENLNDTRPILGHAEPRAPRSIARRPQVWAFALAAAALAACAPSHSTTTADAPRITPVISKSTPTPVAPSTPTTVTVTAPPPVTVTVAPPAPPIPVVQHVSEDGGTFQSPSGNIRCTMYTSTEGHSNAICRVAKHDWTATQPANCHLDWGNRVDLEEGSPARFGCYGQEMPAATYTLEYGQINTLGSISCASDTAGIMCIDKSSGHDFLVSRETVHLG